MNLPLTKTGFGDPGQARAILRKTIRDPCTACTFTKTPPPITCYTSTKTCPNGQQVATLMKGRENGCRGRVLDHKCWQDPKVSSPTPGKPPSNCPCTTFQASIHATCYQEVSPCTHHNKTYWYAILTEGKTEYADCRENRGAHACWNQVAPVGISDGGRVQDQVQQHQIKKLIG